MYSKFIIALLFFASLSTFAESFKIEFDRPAALYSCGEDATFTVSAIDEQGSLLSEGSAEIFLRKEKESDLGKFTMDFATNNPMSITITQTEPCFVWLSINNEDNVYKPKHYASVGFDVENIVATTEDIADFDLFWSEGIARTQAIPLDPRIELLTDFNDADFDGYKISFAHINNSRIYGFMAIPKGVTEPLPVVISVPSAGAGISKPDANMFRNKNLINIVMNVHDFDPANAEEGYKELGKKGTYFLQGAPDREKYFYRQAILGVNRVFEFVEQSSFWDHENLGVWGSSQGGAFAIILSALNPDMVDFASSNVPAFCDHTAYKDGRTPGGIQIISRTPEGTEHMTPYFDVVNFARRVKNPIYISVGFVDFACSPSSVYATYNAISAPKAIFPFPKMGHSADKSFINLTRKTMFERLNIAEQDR